MNKLIGAVLPLCCLLAVDGTAAEKPQSLRDKISYGIGLDFARNLKNLGVNVDLGSLEKGLKAGLEGAKPAIPEEELQKIMGEYQNTLRSKQMAVQNELLEKNGKEGEAFREQYKKGEGVVALPSGLMYKILKKGEGEIPKASDTVSCQYKAKLIDGKVFDDSENHGGPVQFSVQGVIKGWQEAIQLMPVGSSWEVVVPPELAYGNTGSGRVIPPNATLVFQIDLVSIKKDSESKPNG